MELNLNNSIRSFFFLCVSILLFPQCNTYKKSLEAQRQEYENKLARQFHARQYDYIDFNNNKQPTGLGKSTLLISHYDSTNSEHFKILDTLSLDLLKYPSLDSLSINYKIPVKWVGTINYNLRKPSFVIIHHTAQNSCEQTLMTFTKRRTKVSAHYVICKDGTVYQMLNDYLRAWHAGFSKWGNVEDLNSTSIGIELDNNGFETFDSNQINSLLKLLDILKKNYQIPTANFIGHGDIAPIRKNDPNIFFPWKTLSEKGFGIWTDTNDSTNIQFVLPKNAALEFFGYDIKDSTAAWRAFKRHFMQDTTASIVTKNDSITLQKLINKKHYSKGL